MVKVKKYSELEPRRGEILGYAGVYSRPDPMAERLLDSCLEELAESRGGLVCYTEAKLSRDGEDMLLGDISVRSRDIQRHLEGCESAVIFAATVGVLPDRLIRKYGRISPARALMIDAVGSALAESLCDVFCRELREAAVREGSEVTGRFSPGYGDLPLELQRELFTLLDCEKRIGLTLEDSLLMTPSKSVTAIVGVKR